MALARFHGRLAAVLLIMTTSLLLLPTLSAQGASTTLAAASDAYVSAAHADRNYGTAKNLLIDSSPDTNSYITFNVSGQSAFARVMLRVYNQKTSVGFELRTSAAGWTESNLTFASAPAPSAPLGFSGVARADTWTSFDVTSIVRSNGTYSFVLSSYSGSNTSLSSREGANPPQLAIDNGVANPATPVATPTMTTNPTSTPKPATPSPSATATPAVPSTATPRPATATPTATPLPSTPTATATPISTPAGGTSILPTSLTATIGSYDPGQTLGSLTNLRLEHYFVSWDANASWYAGTTMRSMLQSELAYASAHARMPLVTVEPYVANGLKTVDLLQDITAGKYDQNIQWVCADLAAYSRPVIVRWGHEMENLTGRYPWATSNTGAFVTAFRYFVDKCKLLAPNASFMWSPAGNSNLTSYWPGAAYVDYVGLSTYDYPAWEVGYYGFNRTFDQNFSERYNFVKNYAKPIIIAEFGATGTTKYTWLRDAMANLYKYPLLRSVVFFNAQDPAGWGSYPAPDWRIDAAALLPPLG